MFIGLLLALFIGSVGVNVVAHDETCQKGQKYTSESGAGQNFRCTDADRK